MMLCWRSIEAEDEKNDLRYAFRSDCHEESGKKDVLKFDMAAKRRKKHKDQI